MVVAHKEVEHMLAAPGIVLVVVRIVGHKEAERIFIRLRIAHSP